MNIKHACLQKQITNLITYIGQYQYVALEALSSTVYLRQRALKLSKSPTVPHAICPSTKLLTNARQTGIEVLDQSGLNHFIRERQL